MGYYVTQCLDEENQAIINQCSHLYTEETGCKGNKVVILAFPLQTITKQNNHSKYIVLL